MDPKDSVIMRLTCTFFYLLYKVQSIVLLKMVFTQQWIKHNDLSRRGTSSKFWRQNYVKFQYMSALKRLVLNQKQAINLLICKISFRDFLIIIVEILRYHQI